jgi:lipopolysaccharide export system protein LptA
MRALVLQPPPRAVLAALAAAVLAGVAAIAPPARAEKADRSKPIVVEADRPGTIDLQRQIVVFNGNVTVAQGTMTIRADRVEVRESPDGYRSAAAIGGADRLATYRQQRDAAGESVEGAAERIDYDQRADTLRFSGSAVVRRLRDGQVADEISGSEIVWDNRAEVFSVVGGASSPTNPSGRVRAILTPPPKAASSPSPGVPLKPSTTLGNPR